MAYFVFGNYGDNTIALIQWAHERALSELTVLHVDTGWAADSWRTRVVEGVQLAKKYGFNTATLQPPQSFAEQIIDRGQFPSVKFQWCAGFVKGLAFLNWADITDPQCEATVVMGSRRADSRARFDLSEFDENNEHFGGRRVWYPLFDADDASRDQLIQRAGFEVLNHRSYECLPCVFNSAQDLAELGEGDLARVQRVEAKLGRSVRDDNVKDGSLETFSMGCGANYACGE